MERDFVLELRQLRALRPLCPRTINAEFDIAPSRLTGVYRIALGPSAIDAEDEDAFQHRWLTLFARAATGELRMPSGMPVALSYFD